MTASLYGRGLSFPLRVNGDGRLAVSADDDNVRESIRLILLTEPDERLMREEFGCGLRRFLFEPNTATTRRLIRDRILQSIGRWEPRVALDDVTVEADPGNAGLAAINILFRMVATGAAGRMVLTLELKG